MPLEEARVRTFVAGLDARLGGGIPQGHIVLLSGPPGSMKSSLAYSILHQNATHHGSPGLYVSLEQTRGGLLRQMRAMGFSEPPAASWGVVDVATIGKEAGDAARSAWMDMFWRVLRSRRRIQPYEILALDSLDALELLARYPNGREETRGMFESLRQENVTSIVITESMENGGAARGRDRLGASFLADGVISVTLHERPEASLRRRLRVVKMRGTAHETRFYPLGFDNGGFTISESRGV